MDKRATHSLTGTVDGDSAVTAEAPPRAGRPVTGGAGAHHRPDLKKVLRAIAARIDVVLDEKVAAGEEPESRHRAVRAWSSVIAKRPSESTSEQRRNALETTVLRISTDGRVDVDDPQAGAIDRTGHDADDDDAAEDATDDVAEDAAVRAAEGMADSRDASLRQTDAEPPTAELIEPREAVTTDRSDVEDRLRAARERLEARRASATAARVDAPDARARRVRVPIWQRTETRAVLQRLLIGLAIVGASAVVSILIT